MGPNVQDVVTRGGKLFYLYKRPGKRVIVNDFGHMMVCPTLIEATLQQNTAGNVRPCVCPFTAVGPEQMAPFACIICLAVSGMTTCVQNTMSHTCPKTYR